MNLLSIQKQQPPCQRGFYHCCRFHADQQYYHRPNYLYSPLWRRFHRFLTLVSGPIPIQKIITFIIATRTRTITRCWVFTADFVPLQLFRIFHCNITWFSAVFAKIVGTRFFSSQIPGFLPFSPFPPTLLIYFTVFAVHYFRQPYRSIVWLSYCCAWLISIINFMTQTVFRCT